jgi:hypothetical protein
MVQEYQKSILSLFVELELKLAELYNALAELFPEESVFFKTHNVEELKHAQWLEYFKEKVEAGDVLFKEDKTRTYTLKSFIAHTQTILDDAKSGKLAIVAALSLSASIEESLIERKAFDHFTANSPELQFTLKRLLDETREHAVSMKRLKTKYSKPPAL